MSRYGSVTGLSLLWQRFRYTQVFLGTHNETLSVGHARPQSRLFARAEDPVRTRKPSCSEKMLTRKRNLGSIGDMKPKTNVLTLALCLFGEALSFAGDPQMGTWKLNETKSKFSAEAAKNHTVVYETVGENVKITADGTDKDGKSTHNEWTGKFDGKDYPVTGNPTSDMRSYSKVDDRTLKMKIKKDGKVTVTGRIVVSPDSKTRMVTATEAGAEGKSLR